MFLHIYALKMVQDIYRNSWAVYIWGGLLNISQLIGGVIFITKVEGQLVLATLIITLVIAGQMHKKNPFSTLIGLCHLPWLLLLPWLLYRLVTVDHTIQLEVWGYYVVAVIAISLVFDAFDVYRYTKGQKTFSWSSH